MRADAEQSRELPLEVKGREGSNATQHRGVRFRLEMLLKIGQQPLQPGV
jgi:hypothetical protein